jgi:uncharacterized membrane protein
VVLEPKGKLDTMPAEAGVVNGPEDEALAWASIDWREVEEDGLCCIDRSVARVTAISSGEDVGYRAPASSSKATSTRWFGCWS